MDGNQAGPHAGTRRPAPPLINADWSETDWQTLGPRFLELATSATTDWKNRRPSPLADHPALRRKRSPLPDQPVPVEELVEKLSSEFVSGAAYNGHPRWFGYITSSPLPIGIAGDLIASAVNANTALWRVAGAATAIELQTIDWIKEMLGYPTEAEGTFVSGGQFANIVAHAVMRDVKTPWDVREHGLAGPDGAPTRLTIYASSEIHYCHQQAAELLGMGRSAVRLVPVDKNYRMRADSLQQMIGEDRAKGILPAAIVATAGTVGTGAVDPIGDLLAIARNENLWLHVDGAYGAFGVLAPSAPDDLRLIAEADSVACDPHKWLYAPIDAGVTLVRQPGLLHRSFAFHASYLQTEKTDDQVDLMERSPENTRPNRALKVWMGLQALGLEGYREYIEYNIQTAAYMEEVVRATPGLVVAAPRDLSIVCWRVEPEGVPQGPALEKLQTEVIAELERQGIALVSNVKLLDGRTALRACIVNFRTTPEDGEQTVLASARIAAELAEDLRAGA